MRQRFSAALIPLILILTLTLTMAFSSDATTDSRGPPAYDPKNGLWFDEFVSYAQNRGLGWLLYSPNNVVADYKDMQSNEYKSLKTTGANKDDDDIKKAKA